MSDLPHRRLLLALAPLPLVALVTGLAIIAPLGCRKGRSAEAPTFPKAPVILVSVDTLRSDHLPFYGYSGVETPALSALRNDSILFEKAYANVPLTLPSHVSIFTGLLPAAHGVHDNVGYTLRPEAVPLGELMKRGGYRTGGAVSAFILSGRSGLGRGFDFYEDSIELKQAQDPTSLVQRPGAETEAMLRRWVEADTQTPFFAFLHLYEPHTPYEPKEPYRTRYAHNLYDGEIASADEVVGTFLSFLKEKGIYDRALVVFVSDHGESLGEHGEDEHGVFLYRAALQVPLLIKLPKQLHAGASVKGTVALTDLYTTIAEAVALKGVPKIEGNLNLLSLAEGAKAPERNVFAETFFPRTHFGWSELASVLDGRWQYIDAPRGEFYDLESDPLELENLIEKKPGPLRAMKLDLERKKAPFETPGAISDEEKKKLASLGYLSTGATTSSGLLPDPKNEIGVIRQLKEAFSQAKGGKPQEALALFEQLLQKNPRMLDVWQLYSDVLLDLGRPEEALAARKKIVELAPAGASIALSSVADLCLQIGKYDEALRNAGLAKERGDPQASDLVARAWLGKGDLAKAEAEARTGLDEPKLRKKALLMIARIQVQRQEFPKALATSDELLSLSLKTGEVLPIGTHFLRGDILARMDRMADAEREFQEEIRLHPTHNESRAGLALVYASSNRMAEAKRVIAQMVAEVHNADAFARGARALTFFHDPGGAEQLRLEGQRRFPSDLRFKKPA